MVDQLWWKHLWQWSCKIESNDGYNITVIWFTQQRKEWTWLRVFRLIVSRLGDIYQPALLANPKVRITERTGKIDVTRFQKSCRTADSDYNRVSYVTEVTWSRSSSRTWLLILRCYHYICFALKYFLPLLSGPTQYTAEHHHISRPTLYTTHTNERTHTHTHTYR
jgi:hypothetical protein